MATTVKTRLSFYFVWYVLQTITCIIDSLFNHTTTTNCITEYISSEVQGSSRGNGQNFEKNKPETVDAGRDGVSAWRDCDSFAMEFVNSDLRRLNCMWPAKVGL
ncbi:hypothetical protein SUGI_0660320 [Cryptomeria japonica]|nr:hypothetical protein SUGI_0660320 [Cryptomeria japonica]